MIGILLAIITIVYLARDGPRHIPVPNGPQIMGLYLDWRMGSC